MQIQTDIGNALTRKYPEQVVLVVTETPEGKANAMAVGWVTVASGEPLMFALGIDEEVYTYELIVRTRQFVLAFPHAGMAEATLHVGSHSGRGRDKLAECRLATQPAALVRPPLIRDAVANFECELVTVVKPGDCPLAIGKAVAAHVNTDPSLTRLYTVATGHVMAGVAATRPPTIPPG